MKLANANNELMEVLGIITARNAEKLNSEKATIQEIFFVIKNLGKDIIIGFPARKRHQIVIDTAQQQVIFKQTSKYPKIILNMIQTSSESAPKPHLLYLKNEIVLPPFCEKIVTVQESKKAKTHTPFSGPVLIQALPDSLNTYKITSGRMYHPEITSNSISIVLANATSEPIRIKPNNAVA